MKRLIITFIFTIFAVIQIMAENISLRAQAPSMVEVGEKFRIQYSINSQDLSNFSYPDFTGLQVLFGPSTSSSSSVNIINGHYSQSSSTTYTFTVMAEKEGTINIRPASISVNGKTIKSQSLKIRVVKGNANYNSYSNQPQSSNNRVQSQQPTKFLGGNDLYITSSASRTNVSEQEAILLTYKLYVFNPVRLSSLDNKTPALDGFQIQEIPLSNNRMPNTETINGRTYKTLIWKQYVVFPQKTGKLTIPSISFDATIEQVDPKMDPFEAFFNGTGGIIEVKKKVIAPAITINVSSLQNKPNNFSGAVGKFNISSSISSNEVFANDAITLKVKLNGTGNMKLINIPEIAFPKDFETYDAKVNDNFKLSNNGLTGTKEFEYLAVPRHSGKYLIPALKFVYFDISSHSYKTLTTEQYEIIVKKGNGKNNKVSDYTNNQQDIKELAQDIRYIKNNKLYLHQANENLYSSWKYWLAYIVALCIFSFVIIIMNKQKCNNSNLIKTKGNKANKVALKRMKIASKLLGQKEKEQFYDEVMRALYGYIADKLNIPQATLNKDNISIKLTENNVPQELIDQFITTLNDCEFARYAPGDISQNMENVYNSAINTITKIENSIRFYKKSKNINKSLTIVLFIISFSNINIVFASDNKILKNNDSAEKLWNNANKLYSQENYNKAAQLYETILKKYGVSSELYYNLGNCYYKNDNIALSILNYERALRLNPSDNDINANLAFARGKTYDKVTPPSEMFFVTWWKQWTNFANIQTWMTIAFISFIIMLATIVIYLFNNTIKYKKISIYCGFVLLFVTIITNLSAFSQYLVNRNHQYAIIKSDAVNIKSSPAESSTDLFVIHGGAKVEILDNSMTNWYEIKLEEGKQGWIEKSCLEKI